MPTVNVVTVPPAIPYVLVSASDTNPITLVAAVPGQKVRVWGFSLINGTSALFKSNTTAISSVKPTTGGWQQMPLPAGYPSSGAGVPLFETAAGEALIVVAGASGLIGEVYATQGA